MTSKIRLVRPHGAGGMGSVWLADHMALHTQVIVKFIAADLAKNQDAIARFEREAAAASQVKSPHVVQILDFGVTDAAVPFIVMELLEGHDLSAHIEKFGRLDVPQVSEVIAQLCRALARAHERGIVHRDIKPQNIFLCDAGSGELFVKLLDFGIAKGASMQKLDESTKTGTLVGSPYYMSPEQLVGAKDIDFHTDLWSVGVVAFEAMTGTRAFEGETVGALVLRIHNDPLPIPSERCDAVTPAVDAWFAKACARSPSDRFGSAKEMADALVTAVGGDPTKKMTSSGAALARSGDDALVLAKTTKSDSGATPDPRVLTYSGVATSNMLARKPKGLYVAAAFVAVSAGAYGFVRLLTRTDAKRPTADKVQAQAQAETTRIPPPPVTTEEAAPIVRVTSSGEPVPIPIRKLARPAASTAPSVIPSATAPAPPPQATHTARPNEDDIK